MAADEPVTDAPAVVVPPQPKGRATAAKRPTGAAKRGTGAAKAPAAAPAKRRSTARTKASDEPAGSGGDLLPGGPEPAS